MKKSTWQPIRRLWTSLRISQQVWCIFLPHCKLCLVDDNKANWTFWRKNTKLNSINLFLSFLSLPSNFQLCVLWWTLIWQIWSKSPQLPFVWHFAAEEHLLPCFLKGRGACSVKTKLGCFWFSSPAQRLPFYSKARFIVWQFNPLAADSSDWVLVFQEHLLLQLALECRHTTITA